MIERLRESELERLLRPGACGAVIVPRSRIELRCEPRAGAKLFLAHPLPSGAPVGATATRRK